jgi:hypothetical protein
MAATAGHLHRLGFTLWMRPEAGMFVWAQLPDGLDSSEIAMRAGARPRAGARQRLQRLSHGEPLSALQRRSMQ